MTELDVFYKSLSLWVDRAHRVCERVVLCRCAMQVPQVRAIRQSSILATSAKAFSFLILREQAGEKGMLAKVRPCSPPPKFLRGIAWLFQVTALF